MSEGVEVRIPDIFRLNDWQTRRFILIVLSTLIAYDATFPADKFLFEIPILPQLLGFVIFTFIPGFIIIRILRIHNIDRILNILLVVGLSMAFNTFLSFFLNEITFIFNFVPISFISLFVTYNLILTILLTICYFRDSRSLNAINDAKDIEVSLLQISLLVLIPSLSVLGIYLLNYYNINYVNILLTIIISLIPFLYRFREFHVILIWISAISILFSTHLVSDYLWSWDIHFQYYVANLIKENGYWKSDLPQGANSLLAIVLLAPIYSILLDLDLVWVYKIVYPFFFSLVPVGIYYLAKMQFNDDVIAFFSPFVFMFYYGFFKDMTDKQQIAEIFLILSLITMFNGNTRVRMLTILFLSMLPLSHYGVSHIFLFSLIFTLAISYIFRIKNALPIISVFLFAILTIAWYIYTSKMYIFGTIVNVGYHTVSSLIEITKPEIRSGVDYLTAPAPNVLWIIYKAISAILVLCIIIGVIRLIHSYLTRKPICRDWCFGLIAIAFTSFILTLTFKGFELGMDRGLQIALTVLSPFAIVGFMTIFNTISKVTDIATATTVYKFIAMYLCIFILFSSGLIHELAGDQIQYAIALNKNPKWNVYDISEVEGARWLKTNSVGNVAVINPWYAIKSRDGVLLAGYYSSKTIIKLSQNTIKLPNDVCIFLGKVTIREGIIRDKIDELNKIYSSGKSCIVYFSP